MKKNAEALNLDKILCPCCSGKEYEACCKIFHQGGVPETALLLMRSRYSAYALNIPDYIMKTTHPANPHFEKDKRSWRDKLSQFSQNTSFHKLEILSFEEEETSATVTFTAHLSQGGRDATFTEKSYFEKVNNRWLYRLGHIY